MSFYSDLIPKFDILDKEKNFRKYVQYMLKILFCNILIIILPKLLKSVG